MDPAYWQTVALAEQYEMLELMDWYEARKEQFNSQEFLTQGIESCKSEKQNVAKQN